MQIYYDTKTGNVERFVAKIKNERGWEIERIHPGMHIDHPAHLITFTTRFGDVPDSTLEFLSSNASYIQSVSSSGNRNWGRNFAIAADKVSGSYGIPVMLKFELSGTNTDVNTFIHAIEVLEDQPA